MGIVISQRQRAPYWVTSSKELAIQAQNNYTRVKGPHAGPYTSQALQSLLGYLTKHLAWDDRQLMKHLPTPLWQTDWTSHTTSFYQSLWSWKWKQVWSITQTLCWGIKISSLERLWQGYNKVGRRSWHVQSEPLYHSSWLGGHQWFYTGPHPL